MVGAAFPEGYEVALNGALHSTRPHDSFLKVLGYTTQFCQYRAGHAAAA